VRQSVDVLGKRRDGSKLRLTKNEPTSSLFFSHSTKGYNCDYPVEKLMRDCKIFQICKLWGW
jgi:alkylation response protein AidB-like acyl-CoA dehydrogenase